jgi:hypothetical protein
MASGVVGRIALAAAGAGFQRSMVGPLPANPFDRQVILDVGDAYRYGSLVFRPEPRVVLSGASDPRGAEDPLAQAAARTERGRKFLAWSRFPIYRVEPTADGGGRVILQDARYPASRDGNWASTVVTVPPFASP